MRLMCWLMLLGFLMLGSECFFRRVFVGGEVSFLWMVSDFEGNLRGQGVGILLIFSRILLLLVYSLHQEP